IKDVIDKKKRRVFDVLLEHRIKIPKELRKKAESLILEIPGKIKVRKARLLMELKELKKFPKEKEVFKEFPKSKYTQTEALLRAFYPKDTDKIFNFLLKEFLSSYYKKRIKERDLDDYIKIIKEMKEKEEEYSNYYSFYHAHDNAAGLLFDLQAAIRELLDLKLGEKIILRFGSPTKEKTIEKFIKYWGLYFKKNRMKNWDDHEESLRSQVLSVNFAPFGNTGIKGEGTLNFFISGASVYFPELLIKKVIFDKFGFDKKYINKLRKSYNKYMASGKGGNMLQILIPKEKVDQFVYLSRAFGTPFGNVYATVNKKLVGLDGTSAYLNAYTNLNIPFTQESQVIFGSKSKYGILSLINTVQGRIVFLPGFLDPKNGIKIFQYNFATKENREKYKKEFRKIIDEMISEWIETGGFENVKKSKENMPLIKLLRQMKKGEKFLKKKRKGK
ncbi:hypothetical protein ACFLYU_02560, partial [Candidatus Dependentiae bacterium]